MNSYLGENDLIFEPSSSNFLPKDQICIFSFEKTLKQQLVLSKPWGHDATFSCVCNATLLHCMRLENLTVENLMFFMSDAAKTIRKMLHAAPKKKMNK